MNEELEKARLVLGDEKYYKHLREVFGITCLDFVKTLVFNLPEPCYADCAYCIDKNLRSNVIDTETFLRVCERVMEEFPDVINVTIAGGSLKALHFNRLVKMIRERYPNVLITWNTNGIGITSEYNEGIKEIKFINLHRNSLDDEVNRNIFRTGHYIPTIKEAKEIMGDNLNIRVTIDEDFDLDEYVKLGIPLYLNRMLPGTEATDKKFVEVMNCLVDGSKDIRRRNVYVDSTYKGVPIRICMGDKIAKCVPGRYPTFLNVAIVHRSGIVCGSWYENDKKLFDSTQLNSEKTKKLVYETSKKQN